MDTTATAITRRYDHRWELASVIERSADDDLFGFYTRPTKGQIIARAEAA